MLFPLKGKIGSLYIFVTSKSTFSKIESTFSQNGSTFSEIRCPFGRNRSTFLIKAVFVYFA
jgi:hypothetical protein